MPFQRLFSVVCTHRYFAGQPCSEVQVLPTATCRRLIQRFGLLFRLEGAGIFSVLQQQPDTGKSFIPACSDKLEFCLLATDASVFTYTKTAQNPANMLLFDNVGKPAALLNVSETNKWKERFNGGYLFGGVSIIPPNNFRSYSFQLDVPAVSWQYYIVSQKSKERYKIDGSSAGIPFQPVTDAGQLQASSTYQALLQAYPNTPVAWYQSETPLPLTRQARLKIQLINTDTATMLLDNLPNPAPADNGVKVIYV